LPFQSLLIKEYTKKEFYNLRKKFLLDTNILMRSPNAIYVFDDNDVLICSTTLEELDDLKNRPGETGYNAREAIRVLNDLSANGHNLYDGVKLPNSGTLKIVKDCTPDEAEKTKGMLPREWSLGKPDNRIINTAIKNDAILVTNDISMSLKAQSTGLKTENFKNEEVSDESLQYTGRKILYTSSENINKLYQGQSLDIEDVYEYGDTVEETTYQEADLEINEFLIIKDVANPSHTVLAYYNGTNIVKTRFENSKPCDVKARNVGQRFAIEALMTPADEVPLVILKGSAGTAKTFLSLACGLEQAMNRNDYKKLLILRPNIKFDEDIGYLKGDEMDKILPLIRPCLDNLEALVSNKDDSSEESKDKIAHLFDAGYVTAEALAYLRGRSIANTYILIDEAQNTTPNQMLGIITRAGVGSKIVIVGDPEQIDNPKVDRKNNGLVYAAEKMKGSKLCMQLTFEDEECTRSPLALEASQLLAEPNR
jgi:PhoH-like ATPase